MATTIVTKNSSTASAVPTAAQLVQGELAVNVADKKLYTEDNAGSIIVLADGVKLDGIEALADVTDTANVTAAGALMDSELTNITAVKALNQGVATTDSPSFVGLTASGEITANGGIALGDNDKATFGAGDDLQIYHSGAHSFISDVGTGNLYLSAADSFIVRTEGVAVSATFTPAASVDLNYAGSTKLSTTATGIDVTGDVSIGDGSASATRLLMGSGDDSKMFHNGIDTYWINDTGNIIIRNQSDDKDILIQTDDGSGGTTTYITVDGSETDVSLHYGGVEKLATTATGIDVTGTATMDGLVVTGTLGNFAVDTQGAVATFSRPSTSYIRASDVSGSLRFDAGGSLARLNIAANGDISFYEDTGTTAKLFWDASAESLGIGTTSPSTRLHVNTGSAGYGITVAASSQTSGTYQIGIDSNSALAIYDTAATAQRLVLSNAGNVGIGTSSPTAKLHAAISTTGEVARFSAPNGSIGSIILGRPDVSTEGLKLEYDSNTGNCSFGTVSTGHQLLFKSGTAERMRIDSAGNVLIGTSTAGASKLVVNDDSIQVNTAKTPASASATGTTGEIAWDANYVYVCVSTNTWKRSALSTW